MSRKYYSGWPAGQPDGWMKKLVIEPASPVGAGTGAELGNSNLSNMTKPIFLASLLQEVGCKQLSLCLSKVSQPTPSGFEQRHT